MIEVPLSVQCPCGEVVNVTGRRSWSVDAPAELAKLLAGDFNRFPCPRCNVVTGVAVDLVAIHHTAGWAVQIVADDARLAEVSAALREMLPSSRARIVANRMEMIEKARVFAAGLDDVAFAITKFQRWVILDEADRTYTLWFDRVEGDQLIFGAFEGYAKRGEVKTPLAVLERVATMCETALYQRYLIVDQNLAVKVLDLLEQKRAATRTAPPRS